jgi:hypothetical protein
MLDMPAYNTGVFLLRYTHVSSTQLTGLFGAT